MLGRGVAAGAGDFLQRGQRAGARLRLAPQSAFPSDNMMLAPTDPALTDDGDGSASVLPERLRRTVVA